ncbi:heavy metal-associated domain-containing protein [Desulfobacula sp.]|uniref:heavy-metal-associated domain-containing protein n=1 Tax=Desulfobacula sp. TaxID=2593537 RepID=UPI0025BCEAED|nr:heavy metal-associated domain-containing protein [Desulfobacula sp.]MBC2705359.1 heavy-metal-associated domain-containing protein [Desulfobacula sp.]
MASRKATLNVEGMSCSHCSGTVQRTLEQIEGISNVSVDLNAKKASFDTDNSELVDKAIKEINKAGYRA